MKRIQGTVLMIACSMIGSASFSQKAEIPHGWHLMNQADSGYYGISMAQAYDFVKSKQLKSTPVVVAVIDSGIDTLHEDLRPVLWKNPKEIPGNGIDDDKNGYVDDVYGWNFLGNKDGRNVEKDSYESARFYHKYKAEFEGKRLNADSLKGDQRNRYRMWKKAEKDIVGDANPMQTKMMANLLKSMNIGDSLIRKELGKEEYTCEDLAAFTPTAAAGKRVKVIMMDICERNENQEISNQQLLEELEGEVSKAEAATKAPRNFRNEVVRDNYDDLNDRFYGNNNVMVSKSGALHGTHVSGIIAAARGNGVGMDGVADNVRIMSVRAVPDGDEHDKDIALAIRYAVDNGARVINMSFGKGLSPNKKWVDDAVRYADSKGVLLVHAAGNDARDVDTSWNFPTPVFQDSVQASNWVTVGASGPTNKDGGSLTASFSNYGRKQVDVFAPGVQIYSTVPGGNTYQNLQGTSMASPVVAGLAAFILEYYPKLSPAQVKFVIEQSSRVPADSVSQPGTENMVSLRDLSKSGGVINAFDAIKLASTLKPGTLPKSKPIKSKVRQPQKS